MKPATLTPEPLYALFHVNRLTGERVRYPRESFPATDRAQAEANAQDSRIGKARGMASPTMGAADWQTEAHPDTAE